MNNGSYELNECGKCCTIVDNACANFIRNYIFPFCCFAFVGGSIGFFLTTIGFFIYALAINDYRFLNNNNDDDNSIVKLEGIGFASICGIVIIFSLILFSYFCCVPIQNCYNFLVRTIFYKKVNFEYPTTQIEEMNITQSEAQSEARSEQMTIDNNIV